MNDRYLFKAKRVDNGEWVQGVPFEIEGKTVILISDNENILRVHYLEENMWEADIYAIEVDPSTICQSTGLRDKNCKLICENDIVKGKYYDGGKAYEHMGQIKYYCQSYKVVGINQYEGYHAELNGLYEIVGNIFDNPELLESDG